MKDKNLLKEIIREEIEKVILENANQQEFWYHTTKKENVASILEDGLKINQNSNFSEASKEWASEAYGELIAVFRKTSVTPIYLSKNPGLYKGQEDGVILKVNTLGLKLLPDLPSLVDNGGYLTEDGIYFEKQNTPKFMKIKKYKNGEATFIQFLTDQKLIEGSIQLTETAAVLKNIEANRISIFEG